MLTLSGDDSNGMASVTRAPLPNVPVRHTEDGRMATTPYLAVTTSSPLSGVITPRAEHGRP